MKKISAIYLILILLGCNVAENKEIKIGAIMPLSGKMANYGKTSQSALQAMLKVINESRQAKQEPLLDLIIEDDQMEVKGGVNAINKLIQKDQVSAIIGPDASSITLGVAPIAEAKKTVLISPGSTSSDLTKAGDYIFRTIPSSEYESKLSASLYKKLYGEKKLAVMFINNEFGNSLKNNFIKNLEGSAKPLELSYEEKETNFSPYLTKLKSNGIEVIFLIGYNEMVQIYQQANKLKFKVHWLGTAQMGSQSLIDQIGSFAEGTIFPSWELNLEEIKANNSAFYQEYEKLSGGLELDIFAANAVDALNVLNSVIGANAAVTPDQIKEQLYKIKDFNGIAGSFSFDSNGDVEKVTKIKIVKNGKITNYEY